MATEWHAKNRAQQGATIAEKVTQLRQLFAGAPQYAKTADEKVLIETFDVLRSGEYLFMPALSALGKER